MAFSKMTDFTFSHAAQDDTPDLDPTEVKTDFDSRGDEIKDYLDDLIDALNGENASSNIGAKAVSGLSGTTPQALIESLKTALDEAILGAIPDNSLATAKYQDGSVTAAKVAADVATQAELDAVLQAAIDDLDNLAGTGRTTETVKDNADNIDTVTNTLSAHLADYAHHYYADEGNTDAYAIAPDPAITDYAAGQVFNVLCPTANTGAATLNVSGKGAKAIKKNVTADLVTSDILAGQIITVVYDGTNFQIISSILPADASETVKGIIQIATSAEVTAGTDTLKAVTPAGVKVELDKKLNGSKTYGNAAYTDTIPGSSDLLKTIAIGSGKKFGMLTIRRTAISDANTTHGVMVFFDATGDYAKVVGNTQGNYPSVWSARHLGKITNSYYGYYATSNPNIDIVDVYIDGSNLKILFHNNHTSDQALACTLDWEVW